MLDQQRHQINRSRKWQRFVTVKHRKLTEVEFRPKYNRNHWPNHQWSYMIYMYPNHLKLKISSFQHLHLKNTNTVSRDHHFDKDWTHEIKIIRESERTCVSIQKYILMRERRRENNKHAPRAAVLLFVDFYIAFESVIQSSFEFFASIHLLLVLDCPFFVGQRVVSI